jgi:hypothetical protein
MNFEQEFRVKEEDFLKVRRESVKEQNYVS